MIRRPRILPAMVALATLMVPGCMPYQRIPPNPPAVRTAPDTGTGLEPIYGEWQVDRPTPAYAQPAGGSGVVATLGAGQAVTALGRVRNSDWVAVKVGGSTAYVRLHLLSLKGNTPRGSRGTSTTVAKPADNAGPAIKAAPRGKIGATPIANTPIAN